jgi:hypothetical protein
MAVDGRGAAPDGDGRRRGLARARYLGAAARRFLVLLGAVAGCTVLLSVVGGLIFRTSLNRAISVGLYVVGCFLLIAGFFVGNRGPARLKGDGAPLFGQRLVRWASPREREDTLNDSAVFVAVGFSLIILGASVDDRHRLF